MKMHNATCMKKKGFDERSTSVNAYSVLYSLMSKVRTFKDRPFKTILRLQIFHLLTLNSSDVVNSRTF